jgi:hypothetical protein
MTTPLGPASEPSSQTDRHRRLRIPSPWARYRERLQHTHGWEAELRCPACGVVALPAFNGWTPSNAINFGETPTIYADLTCRSCGADLRQAASTKLVELFADVGVPTRNKRLMATFIALILGFEIPGTILSLFERWRELGVALVRAPLLLLAPAILWFNGQIASIRSRCECGRPDYKFMGLLGRSYCYRCSTCGRLLRLRD